MNVDLKVLCNVKRQNNLPGSFKAIEFVDKFGDRKIELFPTRNLLSPKATIEWLVDRHFELPPEENWKDVIDLLKQKTDKTGEIVDQIGFHQKSYLLSNGTIIGPQEKHTLFLDPEHTAHLPDYGVRGTLEDWQSKVAPAALHSSRIMLVIGNVLSGHLLYFVNIESGGFNIFGKSSIGKTNGAKTGVSTVGPRSNLRSWNFTETGAEDLAYGHNDAHLILDELATLDRDPNIAHQKASALTYQISSGKGKSRSKKYERNPKTWRTTLLSTSELSLAEHAKKAGSSRMKGEEVRIIDVPADANEGYGIFESLPPDMEDASSYVKYLDEVTQQYYGTPIIAFLEKLVADFNAEGAEKSVSERIKSYMRLFNDKLEINAAEGTTNRFGDRFALAFAALCMAAEYKVLPFNKKQIFNRISLCYKAALGIKPKTLEERLNICDRRFVKYLKENKFPAIRLKESWTEAELEQIDGFKLTIKDTKVIALKPEVVKSMAPKSLFRHLLKHYQSEGFLLPDAEGNSSRAIRLNNTKTRFICLTWPRNETNIKAANDLIDGSNEQKE